MRDLWFWEDGFEVEIFLFLATPLPAERKELDPLLHSQRSRPLGDKGQTERIFLPRGRKDTKKI
jgi:hypothetical protein